MTRRRLPLPCRTRRPLRPRRSLLILLCAALLSTLGMAACASVQTAPPASGPVPAPLPYFSPAPATTAAPVPVPLGPITAANCPGVASYRPMSPMPLPGHMPAGSTMAAIQRRGHLIVGVDQDEYQVGYRNLAPLPPIGDEYEGFDIDLLHAIAQAVFGDSTTGADLVEYVPVNQDYQLGAANQGIVDVVAGEITTGCARQDQARFSVDYLDSGQRLLMRRKDLKSNDTLDVTVTVGRDGLPEFTGLDGREVCTVGTTASVRNLIALQRGGDFKLVIAGNWSDCLVLLQQGAVAALSANSAVVAGLQAEDPYLIATGDTFSYEPHGLAFPLSDPASADNSQFVGFVNGVIARFESSAGGYCPQPRLPSDPSCWAAVFRRWLEPQLPLPKPPVPVYLP